MQGNFPKKGDIVDLVNLPEHTVIAPGAIQVTNVEVPVRMPDGTVCGKARVVEGDTDEVTVLIELEADNPLVAGLFKGRMHGISIVEIDRAFPGNYIEEVEL